MIPTWKTKKKDKKSQKIGKNCTKQGLRTPCYPLTDPDFEFSHGNNCKNMP